MCDTSRQSAWSTNFSSHEPLSDQLIKCLPCFTQTASSIQPNWATGPSTAVADILYAALTVLLIAALAGYVRHLPATFVRGAPVTGAGGLHGTGAGASYTARLRPPDRGARSIPSMMYLRTYVAFCQCCGASTPPPTYFGDGPLQTWTLQDGQHVSVNAQTMQC